MKTPDEKYAFDPLYRALVDSLIDVIVRYQMTPSEVREAGVFACVHAENIRFQRMSTVHGV